MERFIYAYRLKVDSGNAPCVFDENDRPTKMLSLACCKGGRIQKGKGISTGLRNTIGKKHGEKIASGENEVWLMGTLKNCLLYFAKITEVVTMIEYFSNQKWRSQKDQIYSVVGGESLTRNGSNRLFHPKEDHDGHARDALGKYVLLSDHFVYFGSESRNKPIDKGLIEILPKRQEHLCFSGDEYQRILNFVEGYWDFTECYICNTPNRMLLNETCKGCKQK